MLRELTEAVEALSAQRPVGLVLEDLPWSDGSTLDWLASVVRRREVAQLLVLGTYRSAEAVMQGHPVEHSFAWAARLRRLAQDYGRLPETLAGFHFLVFAMLMLTCVVALMVQNA
jgi:hypothetical protein